MAKNTAQATLTEFLLARIADAQADALELGRLRFSPGTPHIKAARKRILQTEAAHRRIVNASRDYSPELSEGDNGEWAFGHVLRILAAVYADHPDYLPEWRP